MNQRNKEVEAAKLRSEDKVLKDLKREYTEAANRVKEKIKGLAEREQSKSVIYQKRYQEQLLNQINSALNSLDTVNTVSDYLKDSYYNGFMGSLYDIQGQGIPVIVPFDQKAITKMTSTTSDGIKLSKKIYTHVTALKNRVRKEVSIGIASGEMYDQVAARIDRVANIGFNNAYRIARTEGHRVSQASALEAMQAAKDSGADVVKQWDATLDGRTRKEHRKLDGQIAELDQPFRVSGRKAMHPSGFGIPELDINCRCTMTQRAKWALDDDELDELKQRAEYFKLDKSDSFEDFKKNYLKAAEEITETVKKGGIDRSASIYQTLESKHVDKIEELVTKADQRVRDVWSKFESKLTLLNGKYNGGAHFSPRYEGVNLSVKNTFEDTKTGSMTTWFHEFGHNMDYLITKGKERLYFSESYKEGLFGKTIRNEVNNLVNIKHKELQKEYKEAVKNLDLEWLQEHGVVPYYANEETLEVLLKSGYAKYKKANTYDFISKEIRSLTDAQKADLSDILEGATKAKIQGGWGHGKSYWKNKEDWGRDGVATEAFAEMYSAFVANPDSLETMKKYLPESVKVFEEMLTELTKE